MFKVTFFIAGI